MLPERSTPVKMTREAARALPRTALLAVLFLVAFASFCVTDFWTPTDALNYGTARLMLSGDVGHALTPFVADAAQVHVGPLAAWVSAAFLYVLSPLTGDVFALRLASLFWFVAASSALWYGTWQIARRPDAQPVITAFGDEADPKDYGRVVADSALLLFVATFGLALGFHEPTSQTVLLALSSFAFYGLAKALKRPLVGFFLTGLAAAGAMLSATLFAFVWLFLTALVVNARVRQYAGTRLARGLALCAGTFAPVLLWAGACALFAPEAGQWWSAWWHAQRAAFGFFDLPTLTWFLKNFIWFLCPVWPIVAIGLYNWRRGLKRAHLAIPLKMLTCASVSVFFTSYQTPETVFIVFTPALSVLAAFGLFTIKKTRESILDWFSLSIFTLGLATVWAYWAAWATGFAPKMAASIERLAPTAQAHLGAGFVVGLAVTLLWVTLVAWRTTHRPAAAWRGPLLAASGLAVLLVACVTLFHDALNKNRSYSPVVSSILSELDGMGAQKGDCVDASMLPNGITALLAVRSDFDYSSRGSDACRWAVERHKEARVSQETANDSGARIARPAATSEFFVVRDRTQ